MALAACGSSGSTSTATTAGVRHQDWVHVPGTCGPEVEGAVFSRSKEACGGGGSTFDSKQIYISALLADVATDAAPCPGIATGSPCYRMWYVGNDEKDDRRIGYAVSPDGVTWARVPGPAPDGSVLEVRGRRGRRLRQLRCLGPHGRQGRRHVPHVVHGPRQGQRHPRGGLGHLDRRAPLDEGARAGKGGAVLRESKVKGTFDQDELITAHVIKDVSTDAAPCPGMATGSTCYRMWYEGVDKVDYYRYHVGLRRVP